MYLANFSLTDGPKIGIALHALGVEWDLHNYAEFDGFDYSTAITNDSNLTLKWHIAERVIEWRNSHGFPNAQGVPIYPGNSFGLIFFNVNYLEVAPRDPEMPSDEDKCLAAVSFIEADEDSAMYREGAFTNYDPSQQNDVSYHIGFCFRGGQFIRVGAEKAEFVLLGDEPATG